MLDSWGGGGGGGTINQRYAIKSFGSDGPNMLKKHACDLQSLSHTNMWVCIGVAHNTSFICNVSSPDHVRMQGYIYVLNTEFW